MRRAIATAVSAWQGHHVRQIVCVQTVLADGLPRVDEDGEAERRRRLQHLDHGRMVEVVAAHVGADLHRLEAEGMDPLELSERQLGRLHGQGARGEEAVRVLRHGLGDEVVLDAAERGGRAHRAHCLPEVVERALRIPYPGTT